MEDVMNNSDLRKEPKKICHLCNCVCVWDKEVNAHVDIFFYYPEIRTYCLECYGRTFYCNIS